MTTAFIPLIESKHCENTQTTQYTVEAGTNETKVGIVDAFAATNTGTSRVLFSCNLVAEGDTAAGDNLIIDEQAIDPGETYLCPGLIGQVIADRGFISTLCNAASSLVIRASGREVTS